MLKVARQWRATFSIAVLAAEVSPMRYRAIFITVALALLAVTAAFALSSLAPTPRTYLPLTAASSNASPVLPPADAASARLKVPADFAVRIFAAGLNAPRLMAFGPDGSLYVAERGAGRVVRLPDRNRDGLADAVEVVASGLNGPHSVEWHNGALYVALDDQIIRLQDLNADGDMADPGEQTTITNNIPCCGGHSSRTARFGPDGKLYVAAGSSSNTDVEADRRRATIMRFNADGSIPSDNPFASDPDPSRRPVWAEGLRNAVDFLFTDAGQLWATHNGSDGLGDDLPPEAVVIDVARGRHYGWPYCYTAELGAVPGGSQAVRDTRIPLDDRVANCASVAPALFTDLAHQAPLGIANYRGPGVPASYSGSLLIAYHGSWNANQTPRDCRVQRIVVEGGIPTRAEAFLTGFRDDDQQQCGSAWGRPAGVTVGPKGDVFVSDDKNGNIYRIVYVGP
jgi:glucose/arabinose dehydrogenase